MANNYIYFNLRDSFKHLDSSIQAFVYNCDCSFAERKNMANNFRKWRRLDNRFTTLFGSTYEVPLGDYKQLDDEYRVLIFGDKFMQCSSTGIPTENHLIDGYPAMIPVTYIDNLDTMGSIIQQAYPNSSVEVVGEFTKESTYIADIADLWDNLSNKVNNDEDLPTHIIFNGLENTYNKYGYSITYELLSNILQLCKANNINYVCVLCGQNKTRFTYNSLHPSEFLSLLNLISYSYVVDTYKWLSERKDVNNYLDDVYGIQMDITYNYIYDNCFKRAGLDIFRYKYYVSFCNIKIDRTKTADNFFKSGQSRYPRTYEKVIYGTAVPNIYTQNHYALKYGNGEGSFNEFKYSGEFIAIVVHTGYNDKLFASEQFQANCSDEYRYQIDNKTPGGKLLNLLPIRRWYTGNRQKGGQNRELGGYAVPTFPLSGAPWLTISEKNVADYKNDEIISYTPIGVWLTRDDSNMTITTNLKPNADKLELFQSISFGCMDIKPINHVHSLYCGGGSGGLCQGMEVFEDADLDVYQFLHYEGNVYDLSMDNVAMSNSNLLHPTRFNGSTSSNFKFLSSEGLWKNIFTERQDAVVTFMPVDDPKQVISQFAYILSDVVRDSEGSHTIYPRGSNDAHKISGKYITKQGHVNLEGKDELDAVEYKYSSFLQSIYVVLNKSLAHGEACIIGSVPHCFSSWDYELPTGEVEIDDKKYLCIPCGWDGRLYNYVPRAGRVNSIWQSNVVVDDWEKWTRLTRDNVIRDRLLIELE